MSSNDNDGGAAATSGEGAESAPPNGAAAAATSAAAASNGGAAPSSAPRAKINISLKKRKASKKAGAPRAPQAAALLAEEYGTVAEEAEALSKKRKEEGTVLVIPCRQSRNEEEKRKQPLLAGRVALLRQGGEEADGADGGAAADINETANKEDGDAMDDEAVQQLIQSAKQKDGDADGTTPSGRGLVIAAPTQNSLAQQRTANDKPEDHFMNDEEVFQQELSHHAADVDPTSTVYATVAIADFGSALLRGMGWTGGSTDKKGDRPEETVKQRPHRLGLGATPLPLPSAGSSRPSGSGGIHRRARRPDEVKRDEERQKQQEEAERREAEKQRLDVQVTLQKGSVVRVMDREGNGNGTRQRALVVQTAGVPGLNRILVQMEGASEKTSVAKGSVALCSWKELEASPFKKRPMKEESPENGGTSDVKRKAESRRDDDADRDRDRREDRRGSDRERDRRDYSDDDSRRRSEKHKRKKRDRRDRSHDRRSRSRSDSRERGNRLKDRSRRSRSRSGSRERSSRRRDSDRRRQDRSRSPDDRSRSKRSKHTHSSHSQQQQQQQPHWLIPNIRVRLISKKMPKYHLQKGIVQDVLAQTHQTSGPKAVLLMDVDGQVLDKVPERYLETALPKTGGNVIILESRERHHRWQKGRLLEKQSSEGYGVVQLEEDLEVVKVDLDGLAEWCGERMDE